MIEENHTANVATAGMELLALHRITKLIGNAAGEIDTTLSAIFSVLEKTLHIQRASLVLNNPLRGELRIVAGCGLTEEEIERGIYLPGEGICGRIFQTGSSCVVPDILSEPLFLNRTGSRSLIGKDQISFIGVPVFVEGRPEGVLTADRLFGAEVDAQEDVRFLTVLATLIAQFLTLHREISRKEAKLIEENSSLKARLHDKHNSHFIIGHSKPMQEVFSIIDKVASSRVTVLILGESGTGKELVARAVHEGGRHPDRPFIKVNCAALPETLLESELFGHEKGAFTSAHVSRPGRFELADGGTIFLDEIGEMPLSVQAKMLRVLQEKQFERVGGTTTFSVDARIVAATNVSLTAAVEEGRFRADLFYRLNIVPIHLPPLRERRDDVPLLLNHFLSRSNDRNERNLKLTEELLDLFMEYSWPGNVREMQNLVERMVILSEGDRLTLEDLPRGFSLRSAPASQTRPVAGGSSLQPGSNAPQSLEEIERHEIEAALKRNGWVQVRAARELGLTERQIGYRIKKYGLNRYDSFR